MNIRREDLERLSVDERLQLLEDIWDSLAESPDLLPLTEAQRELLDERLAEYERDPTNTKSWEEVRERLEHDE